MSAGSVEHDDFDWAEPAVRTGFTMVPTWVHDRNDLSLYEKAAYGAVARFVNRKEGSSARPGVPALATAAGCGETRMREGLKGLEDKGILTIQRRGLGRTNRYRLRFADPGPTPSPREVQEPQHCADQDPHPVVDRSSRGEVADPQPVVRNQTRVNQTSRNQTEAAAADAREVDVEMLAGVGRVQQAATTYEQHVKAHVESVPEWEPAMVRGAANGILSLIQGAPSAPWAMIAASAAAARMGGDLTTGSPIVALQFKLQDWTRGNLDSGKRRGAASDPFALLRQVEAEGQTTGTAGDVVDGTAVDVPGEGRAA